MTSTLRSKNRQTQAMSTESIGLQLETIPVSPADIERARQLQSREIEFVPGDWMENYELPFQISLEDTDRISRENEAELFRAMNLLKSRADQLRGQLSPQSPSLALMDQVDALLARAQQIRNYLVRMFMNLVPIIAKRLSNSRYTLDELSSEGYVTILRAVEKFDIGRGYRFSTYATHALRRNLYRFVVKGRTQQQRECAAESMDNVMDLHKWTWGFQKRMESAVANLTKCIGRLSDRDQSIVQARFGLGQWQQPCTLQSIADRLGVSRERVRQLEARALSRLGKMARETPGEGEFETD